MTLADLVSRHAAATPGKAAIRFEGAVLAYAELDERIGRAAGALARLGIGTGDRVAVLAHNHPDTLVLLYACARLGAMLVPLNWRLAVPELVFILADAEPGVLVVAEAFEGIAGPLAEALPACRIVGLDHVARDGRFDDLVADASPASGSGDLGAPVLLVYTSGTTGRPKGAMLAQEALVQNAAMSRDMHGLTAADHVLTVLPLFHVGGMNIQTTPALQEGATVTLLERFTPEATLAALVEARPTLTVLVPATIQALAAHPGFAEAELSCLRAIATGSSVVPQKLVDTIERRGVPVLQVYGATETCPIAIYTRLGGPATRPGSTGWPGATCEARVVGEDGAELPHGAAGEIEVRGPNVLSGYWRNPAASAEALHGGWFRTGDIATRDADGAFTVHDRKKSLIISGGENIYPAEIERVLLTHPAVAEAAVIGQPDSKWGEVPVAHVILRPGATVEDEALREHVAAELARFKVPRAIVFVDDLPRTALGKVQHFRLKQAAAG